MNKLDPRIRVVWILQAVLLATVIGTIGVLAARFFDLSTLIPIGLAVVIVVGGAVHALLRYRNWRYVVGDDAVYLERGVFTQVRTEVPLVRVQHVDSRRSAFERLVGLASTVVYTAGSRGADVTIPGLTPGDADSLRKRLKGLVVDTDGEDAV